MAECFTCSSDHYPNKDQTSCIPKVVIFLSYEEPLGITLAICALTFSVITVLVLGLFVKHHKSPIVKINNRRLTYNLLISLLLGFLCPLLQIGHPEKVTCILRRIAFGIIFVMTLSAVLAKTVTVVLAFKSTQPGSPMKSWVGKRPACCIILLCNMFEAIICIVQLTIFPPFPEADMHSSNEEITMGCTQPSLIIISSEMLYWSFLAIVFFTVAFLARNLPDAFNEAKFISFSMIVFSSVWLGYIPVFLLTKGKNRAVMKTLSMLASSAAMLVCMFFPKCYIILWRPHLNSREQVKIRKLKK